MNPPTLPYALRHVALASPGRAQLTFSVAAAVAFLCALMISLQPSALWLSFGATALLTWLLPGAALIGLWRLPEMDELAGLMLTPALGWMWLIVIGLLLHWLPGPVTPMLISAGYGGGLLLLLLALWYGNRQGHGVSLVSTPARVWLQVGLLGLFLLLLWLPALGAREFFHDESTVLVRARDAIRGAFDAPARHTKGPGEIIAALIFYRTLGTVNEFYARLPFALAGICAVLLSVPLGMRLFSSQDTGAAFTPLGLRAGLLAALLMGVNGYVLALSRMTQYQGPLLMLIAAAALAAWMIAQLRDGRGLPWLLLLIALAAIALVMHYEFLFMLPMLGVMTLLGRIWQWPRSAGRLTLVGGFLAMGGGLVALVYTQMLTNDYYAKSTQYYYSARFDVSRSHNFSEFLNLSTLYNSTYFFVGLLLLSALGLLLAWRRQRQAALLLTLWFLPTLLIYLFIIESPGTHYYTMMGAWSLLAALPLAALFDFQSSAYGLLRRVGALAFTLWLVVAVAYLQIALLRTDPPYLLEFNERQQPFYVVPYDATFAAVPRVGLPINEGWQTLGALRELNVFQGSYSSNERRTRWYLGDFDRVDVTAAPDYFLIARHVQDLDRAYHPDLLDGYTAVGEVQVADQPHITIYRRGDSDGAFAVYSAEDFTDAFRSHVATLGDEPSVTPLVRDAALSLALTLAMAGVEQTAVARGAPLLLELNWQISQPIGQNLKLFVHIGEDAGGAPLAQWDGFPRMNAARTTDWQAGDSLREWVVVPIPPEMPRGMHPLFLGFYDANTGERYGVGRLPIGEIRVR